MLWLRRYQGSARPGSDGVAVVLCRQVQHQAVALWDAAKAQIGNGSLFCKFLAADVVCNLDDSTVEACSASFVVAYVVGDGGDNLIRTLGGPGKNVLGHGTFAPVDELVLVSSLPSFLAGWVLSLGLVPW